MRIGESYEYVVRVALAEGLPRREGESSERFRVVARDTFAPEAPTGLVVVQEGPAVRLFWNPNSERDLAGYRVYRRQGSGAWERIGPELIDQPSFIHRDVAPDQRLSYYVTAIDRAPEPNESEGSAIEELEIVADPAGETP